MFRFSISLAVLLLVSTCLGQVSDFQYELLVKHYNNSVHVGPKACRTIDSHEPVECVPVGQLRPGTIGYIDMWEGTFVRQLNDGFVVRLYDYQTMDTFGFLCNTKYDIIAGEDVHIHGLVRVVGTYKNFGVEMRVLEMLDNEQIIAEMKELYKDFEPQFREWTVNGKKITAKATEIKGNKCVLEAKNGTVQKVGFNDLSKIDVKECKKQEIMNKVLHDLKTPRVWKFKGGMKPFKGSIAMILFAPGEIVLLGEDGVCQNFKIDSLAKEEAGFFKRLLSLFSKLKRENKKLDKAIEEQK